MVRFLLLTAVLVSLFVARAGILAADEPARPVDSARVDGVFEIKAKDPSIDGMVLTITLFEFDPRLAGASADALDKVEVSDVSHETGKTTTVKFSVGVDKTISKGREYYVTCQGHRNKEQVYHGVPAHGGIGAVLTNGLPVKVTFTGKRMKSSGPANAEDEDMEPGIVRVWERENTN